jgi:hypothetical protein
MNVCPLGVVEFGPRRKPRNEIELFLWTECGVALVGGEKFVRHVEGDFGLDRRPAALQRYGMFARVKVFHRRIAHVHPRMGYLLLSGPS